MNDEEFLTERANRRESDLALVLQVRGEIHRRHAALPELALDAIATAKGGSETCRDIIHRVSLAWVIVSWSISCHGNSCVSPRD